MNNFFCFPNFIKYILLTFYNSKKHLKKKDLAKSSKKVHSVL